ncbi:hypothetical protein ASE73_15475 [Sphingomonas sp. Leaf24]|uniref:hypothetical protein n=1 Tax=unclassified Sphingomonas TaxID=196159 RepID=UPI0006F66982|nr:MULTISPECIES: hypothetical protein [unclassified Sphingomonas]KQM21449.1 hypothetical protein ASE50_13700 [Sphingomonas sp. Leaf5]KQM93566.1 hypothetical protein ASE73_15475 [Sphingomonas sp. Leaf24]
MFLPDVGAPVPVRQATRLINHFQLHAGSAAMRAAGRHFDSGALLVLLLRNAVRSTPGGRCSISSLAASLRRPRESIRRASIALAGQGLCQADGDGLRLPDGFADLPAMIAMRDDVLALLRQMLDGFVHGGLTFPRAGVVPGDDALLAAALDVYLSVYELSEAPLVTPMGLYVVGAISVLNAAAITHDPELGHRYGFAHTIPPDDIRRPASLQAVAEIDGFPYPTIWRHATAARLAGALRRVPDGYLLGTRYMDDPHTNAASVVKVQHVRRILSDLMAGQYRSAETGKG